jgi:4-oxalocrotonate tautomerase
LSPCTRERLDSEFTEEAFMPLIQVSVIEGVFTEAQKRQIVHKLTDAMVSIEGETLRPVTWVIVEEVKSGDWGIGGKPLTTADVKALAAGKPTGERAWAQPGPAADRPRD